MNNKAIYQIAGTVMTLVMILGNIIPVQAQTTGPSIYWGAMVDGKVPSSTNLQGVFNTFETRSKKKMSIIHWGQPWVMSDGSWGEFQTAYFTNARNHGSIPMLNWTSWRLGRGASQPDFQLRDIYEGKYDTYIRRWATAAKNWGHPFFLRFNHEMNGWWYPWGEGKLTNGTIVNGNSAGDFIKAWRHVHGIFKSVGATNVTWVWAPNHMSTSSQYPALSTLYPGDAYVGWTGLSAYNKYSTWAGLNPLLTGSGGMTWFRNSYKTVLSVAPYKPMMLAEMASIEAGDGGTKKAAWIKDALTTQIPVNFPKIKAVVWMNWDINAGKTYPIESSTAATNAWAAAIGSTKYAANKFASLNTSPIPPPSGTTTSSTSADLPLETAETLPASPAKPAATHTASPTETTTLPASPTGTATPAASPTEPVETPTTSPTGTAPTILPATQTEASATLTAVADSYTDGTNPSSAVGGASTTLYVNASAGQKTFLKFDLAQLAGKTISTVKLKIKTTADAAASSVDSMNINLVTDTLWKEQYLSYDNTIAISNTVLGTLSANSAPDTWYEITLTPSTIQPNAGGLLTVAIESAGSDELLLYSREATDKPQLIIVYQ